MSLTFRAICPKGLESLLQDELATLGAESSKQSPGSVTFEGDWEVAYRACLWSRLANRILYPLATAKVEDAKNLYDLAQSIDWQMHMQLKHRFRIDFRGTNRQLNHEQFSARTIKDAIADQFREDTGQRPSVDLKDPDIGLFGYLNKGSCTLYLDLSGPSLHRRGYRLMQGEAPIKENLAAALLIRAGWPAMDSQLALIDPLCGSGTLLIEGLMMRADIAPGLYREAFGFEQWLGFDEKLWLGLLAEAKQREAQGREKLVANYWGFEQDKRTLRAAQANLGKLGLDAFIKLQGQSFESQTEPLPKGLIISNPPYGERLGEFHNLLPLYRNLGNWLKAQQGSTAGIICSESELMQSTGIHSHKQYKFFNGKIPCQLYCFNLTEENFYQSRGSVKDNNRLKPLYNRLKKNLDKQRSWAEKLELDCFRIYDHDLPDYAFAIDFYQDNLLIYESAAPAKLDDSTVKRHRSEMLSVLTELCNITADSILFKTRARQKGRAQYDKQNNRKSVIKVREGGLLFEVNLSDYLDTGLFLDHRKTRARIRDLAQGKDFLNLFCYTATASVYAAIGGAKSTTSVDLSNTYIDWAKRNFQHNRLLNNQQHFIKADCFKWISQCKQQYDLIFLDPPSFSNSKSMTNDLDIQRDHMHLIKQVMSCLRPDGLLIFSTNKQRFKLDKACFELFRVKDLQYSTLSQDFRKQKAPHHCWDIQHRQD